jgi:hypothetical protein
MSEWDPIGVNDTPEAADEYDDYIGPVLDLLNAKASSEQVAGYLREVETQRMSLTDAQGEPLLPAEKRDAAVSSLKLLMPDGQKPDKRASPRGFRHWSSLQRPSHLHLRKHSSGAKRVSALVAVLMHTSVKTRDIRGNTRQGKAGRFSSSHWTLANDAVIEIAG